MPAEGGPAALAQTRRDVILEVARARSTNDVLFALVNGAARALGASSATAALIGFSGPGAVARAQRGARVAILEAPPPLVHALRPLLASRPEGLHVPDAHACDLSSVAGSAKRELPRSGALLAVPLRARSGRNDAILYVIRETPFDEEEIVFALDLARHGVVALAHARREALARAAQERLATFSTFSGDVMWDWEPANGRIWWSENTARELQDPPPELLRPPPERQALVHPEDWPGYARAYAEALASGVGSWTHELRLVPRPGEEISIVERGWFMRDTEGRATRVFGSISDATGRREAERLRAERDAALRTERLQAQFLANISHEIRTPLGVVIGLADLLKDTPLNAEQIEFARGIRASADHLLGVISDILDLSKLQAGHTALDAAPFEIRAAIRASVDMLSPKAREKGIAFHVAVDEELPTWVEGDAGRLRQVLVNILGNAIKFTDAGHVRLQVEAQEDDRVRFVVEDTGVGIEAAQTARLFRPFTQLHASAGRHYGGTGLGLTISKRFIEMMGGAIEVASEPGRGTTFAFTIRAPAASPPAHAAGQAEKLPEGLAVLVVDDIAANRLLAVRMLEKLGLRPDVASDGEEAVEAVLRRAYDVVFMDVQLPGVDGIEATRRIRASDVHQPRIIAMTASALRGDRQRCLAAGMDDHLAKPVLLADLRAAIGRALADESAPLPPPRADEAFDHLAQFQPAERAEIMGIIRREVPARIAALRAAAAAKDASTISMEAHRLRGTARLLGLPRVSAICVEIELLVRSAAPAADVAIAASRLLAEIPPELREATASEARAPDA